MNWKRWQIGGKSGTVSWLPNMKRMENSVSGYWIVELCEDDVNWYACSDNYGEGVARFATSGDASLFAEDVLEDFENYGIDVRVSIAFVNEVGA